MKYKIIIGLLILSLFLGGCSAIEISRTTTKSNQTIVMEPAINTISDSDIDETLQKIETISKSVEQKKISESELISYPENYPSELENTEKDNNLKKCDLSSKDIKIEDFILSREELPESFSQKNSWGDYEIKNVTPAIQIYATDLNEYQKEGKRRFFSLQNFYGRVSVMEYKDSTTAKTTFSEIITEIKSNNRNIKQESGLYGEERIEYELMGPYGLHTYTICFRISKFIVRTSSYGFYANSEHPIAIAKSINNKVACIEK